MNFALRAYTAPDFSKKNLRLHRSPFGFLRLPMPLRLKDTMP